MRHRCLITRCLFVGLCLLVACKEGESPAPAPAEREPAPPLASSAATASTATAADTASVGTAAVGTATAADTATAAGTAAAGTAAASPSSVPPPANVVLLTIDSMRAHMPWTGYERDIAPNLTKLAKESANYTHAYAVASGTPKSVSALLSGRYPSSIYRSGYFFASFAQSNLFFTEVLQQHGVRTLGGQAHGYFDRGKNLDQGFDLWKITPGIDFDNSTDKHVTSDKLTKLAIDMLSDRANSSGQFFMWLHYMDPHDQYLQHADTPVFGKKARDRYDSEIFYTDSHVGKLLDYLRGQPYWPHTFIIVSADHGEAFGEHEMYKHGFELWETITRVPLLVHGPGVKARQIDVRRSHIDLAPTILHLMGLEPAQRSFQGRSFRDELLGGEPEVREPIVLDLPEDHDSLDRRAIIQGDYKLLVKNRGMNKLLFNLKLDPLETTDLAKKEPAKLAELFALYEQTVERIQPVAPFGGMKLRGGGTANGPTGPAE